MQYTLHHGDNYETLSTYPDNHFDSIVTDPPYGIDFLGKGWDAHTGEVNLYKECLRVLKPGGYILAFSSPRTYHKLATSIEEAGFDIKDQIMWIYSSGFPKSQDIGKQIYKKEHGDLEVLLDNNDLEPCKHPGNLMGSHSTSLYGGYTKSGCQIFRHKTTGKIYEQLTDIRGENYSTLDGKDGKGLIYREIIEDNTNEWSGWGTQLKPAHEPIVMARKPSKLSIANNCLEYGVGALNIDASRIGYESEAGRFPSNVIGEIEGYQKYFFCPKTQKSERHIGFDNVTTIGSIQNIQNHPDWDPSVGMDNRRLKDKLNASGKFSRNSHPCVKPIALMEYLIKLVTPAGGIVLDPFNGSGSTGCAAVKNGYQYIGCELDEKYIDISHKRIQYIINQDKPHNNFDDIFE